MLIIFILLILSIQAINFNYILKKREIICFGDQVGVDLLVKGNIQANLKDYSLKIQNPIRFKVQGYLHQSTGDFNQTFEFITKTAHSIQMCVQNLHTQDLIFQVKLEYNVEAKVEQEQQQQQQLLTSSMDNAIQKFKKLLGIVQESYNQLKQKQEQQFLNYQSVNKTILIQSIIFIISSIMLTYAVAYKFKRMQKKKL